MTVRFCGQVPAAERLHQVGGNVVATGGEELCTEVVAGKHHLAAVADWLDGLAQELVGQGVAVRVDNRPAQVGWVVYKILKVTQFSYLIWLTTLSTWWMSRWPSMLG